jgi:3'-5' exoribonuclease
VEYLKEFRAFTYESGGIVKLGDLFNDEYLEKLGLSTKSTANHKMISEISENDFVSVDLKVVSKKMQESKDGKKFLLLTLADRTGEVRAIDWYNAGENDSKVKVNSIVKIKGRANVYFDKLQITLDKDRDSLITLKDGEYDPNLFVSITKKDVGAMYTEFQSILSNISNKEIKALVNVPFEDDTFVESFLTAPAAIVVHHAYKGGLLEHTLGVIKLSREIAHLYPDVNEDVLIAGAAFHDLGKIQEYEIKSFGIERTTEGELVGHIVLGIKMIDEWAKKVPNLPLKDLRHIEHLVLSHHGELELGSPTVPKTVEAIILHSADDLDSKMGQISSLKEKGSENDWSEYDRYLGRKIKFNWDDNED